jgi:hypothetical protein
MGVSELVSKFNIVTLFAAIGFVGASNLKDSTFIACQG